MSVLPAWRRLVVPLVVSALVWSLSLLFLARTDTLNPLDEHTHFDYMVKIAEDFDLPPINDQLGQTSLSTWSCDTAPAFASLNCGASAQDPASAPWAGWSSATGYLPTYYATTGVGAALVHSIMGGSWLDATRLASSLWLALLAGMLVGVARRLGATDSGAAAAGILVGAMPLLVVQGTSLNNDVAAAALAVTSVWAWLRLSGSRTVRRLAVSGLVALLALTTKETALLALFVVCFLELSQQFQARDPERSRDRWAFLWIPAAFAAAVLVGFGMLKVLDPVVRGVTASKGPQLMKDALLAAKPQDWQVAAADAYSGLYRALQSPIPSAVVTPWTQGVAMLVIVVGMGGLVFAVSRTTCPWRESQANVVRQATLTFTVLFPPILMTAIALQGWPVFFESRYLLPAAAIAVVLLAPGASKAWSRAGLVGALGFFMLLAVQIASL
jgi:hypothetical protein